MSKLEEHPMFERVPPEKEEGDPCIDCMRAGTDEAQKVLRKEGSIWHAVFRKRDVTQADQMAKVEAEYMAKFYN